MEENEEQYKYSGKADNLDIKCVFENNANEENSERRFICTYYIGDKYLSPWKFKSMIRVRIM